MNNEFDRIVPKEFRKIAQNDSVTGAPIAVVYFNKAENQYFIQAAKVLPDGAYTTITFGPLPAHVFESLAHILADVKSMDRRYYNLD